MTPTPVTDEFLVNTHTDGFQHQPTVAALAGGGFVVTWESQGSGGVGTLPGGNFFDVHAQLYDAAGNPVGDEFRVNTFTSNLQADAAVAALPDGGFVVTWASSSQDGDPNFGVYGQRFDATGAPVGSEFHIDAEPPPFNTDNGQRLPTVVALSGDRFVVTWTAGGQDGIPLSPGIFGRVYDVSGNSTPLPVAGEFHINTTTAGPQQFSSVTALDNGGFVVTWASGASVAETDIFAQRFDATGAPVGGEFQVNTETFSEQTFPSTAALAGGGFVVTWSSVDPSDFDFNISGRLFDRFGEPVGGEFTVNTETGNRQVFSSVTALSDGGFVVTWQSRNQDQPGSGNFGVFGQRFDATGAPVGGEFQINQTIAGDQGLTTAGDYAIAELASGELVVVWSSAPPNGFTDVYARRFAVPALTDDVSVVGSPDIVIDLSAFINVGGSVTIADNDNAATIDLSNLLSVGRNFTYSSNGAVLAVSVPNLTEVVGDLDVSNNTSALQIDISDLQNVGGSVNVSGNTAVEDIDFGGLFDVERSFNVSGNSSLDNMVAGALTRVGGDLSVTDNASLANVLLPSLTEVVGDLDVSNNTSALQIDISDLQNAGAVNVSGNTAVEDIDFSGLFDVERSFNVSGNSSLENMVAGALTQVGGDLSVTDNASLVSITLPNLATVNGNLTIAGNDALAGVTIIGPVTVAGDVTLEVSAEGTTNFITTGDTDTGGGDVNTTVTDGTSNTIMIGDTNTGGGNVNTTVTDGTSNTIMIGDANTGGGNVNATITDGTSNTIMLGDTNTGGGDLNVATEGTSNTVTIGDVETDGGDVNVTATEGTADITVGTVATGEGDVTIAAGSDATAVDASGFGADGGEVVMTGDPEGDTTVTIGSLEGTDGTVTITGAGGVTVTVEGGVEGVALTGTEGDDTVTGSATEANTMEGGGGDDDLTGGAAADAIDGGEGDDTLSAGDGDDEVDGGEGDDTILGGHGRGNDRYTGGTGIDRVTYLSTALGIIVDLAAGTASGAEIDSDTLIGIENVSGGAGGDTISGDGGANVLDGLGGDDRMAGRGGNDTVSGGEGNDTVVFSGRRSDYTIEATSAPNTYRVIDNRAGPNDGTDLVSDFELFAFSDGTVAEADILNPPPVFNVINGTARNDRLHGTAGADAINGLGGNDLIDARGGNDLITAGAGLDTVLAGGGNDTVMATASDGHDLYYGDSGADTFDFSQTTASATVSLGTTILGFTVNGAGFASSAQIGTDVLIDFENVTGGSGNDEITGDDLANVLRGGAGNDTIAGLRGNDTLAGDAGNDRLIGGRGSDQMTGGSGADRYVFQVAQSRAGEVDTITDFAVGQDHLLFQGLSVVQTSQLDVNGDAVLDTSLTLSDGAVVQLLGVNGVSDWHVLL